MVCATARRAPISAYFEFEAHPEPRIEYTARLDRAIMNSTPKFRSARAYGIGNGDHIVKANVKANVGVSTNRSGEEVDGRIGSLVKSFTASAIGWRIPQGPTTFGPFRSCIYPRTFRSIKVRKATASSTEAM